MSSKLTERVTRSFGVRLGLWYFGLFVAGSVIILALAYVLLAASLRARDREVIESTLVRYARAYERGGLSALHRIIDTDRDAGRVEPLFVRVLGRDESAVYVRMPGDWSGFDPAQLSVPTLRGGSAWAAIATADGDERLEVASARLPGGALFQVGKSTRTRDDLLERFRNIALLLLGAVVMAGLAGGRMITWSALRPLRDLARTVESILRTGGTEARVPVPPARDELGDLAALINRMLDRIDGLIGRLRGSLDNVAHDLRTPMTRLRATAESALGSGNPGEQREALADCLEESERVMTMLDALMDIAEAETGALRLHVEATDVAAAIRQVADLYADVAEEKRIAVDVDLPSELPATLDRTRLTQALANLLDNALKYTPAGGRVRMTASAGAREVTIEVADTGVGIPADELPRIWDRLFRGDRSRTERGLGLGLSLVRAIVEAHGGSVAARSTPGDGSVFTVRLPYMTPM